MGVEVRGGEFMLNTPNLLKGKPGVRENYFVLWFSSPFGIESSVFSHFIFPWKRCDYCLLKTFSDYGVINACESKPVKWKRRIWPLRLLRFDYYGLWYLSICVHCSRFVSVAKTKHADQEQLRGVGRGACLFSFQLQVSVYFGEKARQELKKWVTSHPQLRTDVSILPSCLLLLLGLVWLCLTQHRTPCLGMVPPRAGWVFLHQLVIMTISHRYAHRPALSGWFLSLASVLRWF